MLFNAEPHPYCSCSKSRRSYSDAENSLSDLLIKVHGRTGRPAGDEGFISEFEKLTGKALKKKKPGRKAKK